MLRTHTCGELSKKDSGKKITLAGWVDSVRISGKIGFLDLRDRYGKTQVFLNKELAHEFRNLNKEDILQIEGEVKTRPPSQVKEKGTGEIEVSAAIVKVLKKIPPLPLDLEVNSTEETRMKYRYIDLRRPEMRDALIVRHKLTMAIRKFMDQRGFLEIETPFLAKSTPEGSRDYIVPARNFPGQFYALPQSPQIFKQLLMVGGIDKYFQIVRCFRDEDLRADRQPEFTQLDIEMSFIEEEDVYALMEQLMQFAFKEVLNEEIPIPFPRMTYDQAMKQYNSDKPDTRKETGKKYSFLWVTEFPMFEFSKEDNRYVAMHHPFTSPNISDLKYIHNDKDRVRSRAYDLILNGSEIGGGSIRISDEAIQKEVFTAIGMSEKEVQRKFGFLLDALKYAPPHGGLAFGLDRWAMIMAGKESIRDVIAFPKNKDARDLMMDSPSEISGEQLEEVHLKVKK
ncbi:MAG TPA: aspartate--tRNA ligase [Candidatus Nanoarchaeia archaeon]|nr:aspartate--tRNA ligase [Candidatus Nanoarchaeia archaeon]